jgi:hypothetical protein
MQQTDVRIDALYDFAIEFEHEAQHAMRGRMLRAEIDAEIALAGRGLRNIIHRFGVSLPFSSRHARM